MRVLAGTLAALFVLGASAAFASPAPTSGLMAEQKAYQEMVTAKCEAEAVARLAPRKVEGAATGEPLHFFYLDQDNVSHEISEAEFIDHAVYDCTRQHLEPDIQLEPVSAPELT